MTVAETIKLTCDVCGKTQQLPGITGWWKLDVHPRSIDTRSFGDPDALRTRWDLCSIRCVYDWANHRLPTP
jgi:hypothetical protein